VGTPAYVYDLEHLQKNAGEVLAFPNAFGITVRFAMKASPNATILKILEAQVSETMMHKEMSGIFSEFIIIIIF
jgi:diaminopimelate decarboxylase